MGLTTGLDLVTIDKTITKSRSRLNTRTESDTTLLQWMHHGYQSPCPFQRTRDRNQIVFVERGALGVRWKGFVESPVLVSEPSLAVHMP